MLYLHSQPSPTQERWTHWEFCTLRQHMQTHCVPQEREKKPQDEPLSGPEVAWNPALERRRIYRAPEKTQRSKSLEVVLSKLCGAGQGHKETALVCLFLGESSLALTNFLVGTAAPAALSSFLTLPALLPLATLGKYIACDLESLGSRGGW